MPTLGRPRRVRLRAALISFVLSVVAFTSPSTALPAGGEPSVDLIEGIWELSGCDEFECASGFVRIARRGALSGTAHTDVHFTGPLDCTHEEGTQMWAIYPNGPGSYSGTHKGFIDNGGGCELVEAWEATWTLDEQDDWKGEFCSRVAQPGSEWKCWDMERYRNSRGTRWFGALVDMKAKGSFTIKGSKPEGYRRTKAEAPSVIFELMWDGEEDFEDAAGDIPLESSGELTLVDVIGKGDDRRKVRTVLDLDSYRSVFPMPDENGFIDSVELDFIATVVDSDVKACKGVEGFVWLGLSANAKGMTVHLGSDCRYYSFVDGRPEDSYVDVRLFTFGESPPA